MTAALQLPATWVHPLEHPMMWGSYHPMPTVLATGPLLVRSTYMRQGRASRWHRPREGVQWPTGRISWQAWCGTALSSGNGVDTADVVPDDGRQVCGTCEGRAQGAGHPAVALAPMRGIGVVFAPRRASTPPRVCPGSQTLLCTGIGGRAVRCGVCGLPVRTRAHGGWASGGYGMQKHTPGPDLIPGCSWHGWQHIARLGDGSIGCAPCAPQLRLEAL